MNFIIATILVLQLALTADADVTKHKFCYDKYPILDGLICYKECDDGYSHWGGGPVCWGNCPPRTTDIGAVCTKDSYVRGVGRPLSTCPSDKEKDGLLCYPLCKSGYYGVGPLCWAYCKSDYDDDGALCRRNAHIYGRNTDNCPWHDKCGLCGGPWYNVCGKRRNCGESCKSGYHDDGCTCRRDVHIYAKHTYGRGAGSPMGCTSEEEEDAGLCYKYCDEGLKGVGPVCWATCSGETTDTGTQCQKKSYGRGVGVIINCIKSPTLDDITNSSGLISIMEQRENIGTFTAGICSAFYLQIRPWIIATQGFNNCHKEDEWTTMSISYSGEVAVGIKGSAEVGVAVDIKRGKGICYAGFCAGVKTDISINVEITIGYWRSVDDVVGSCNLIAAGVDIPGTEIGFGGNWGITDSGEYIFTGISLGVGVGILPVEISYSRCYAPPEGAVKFDF